MCLSPDQMTSEQLQIRIDDIRRSLDSGTLSYYLQNLYEGRLKQFEALLKEKAESGEMV